MTWVWILGTTWRKEKTDSHKLSCDLRTHHGVRPHADTQDKYNQVSLTFWDSCLLVLLGEFYRKHNLIRCNYTFIFKQHRCQNKNFFLKKKRKSRKGSLFSCFGCLKYWEHVPTMPVQDWWRQCSCKIQTFFSHQPTVRSWFIPPSSIGGCWKHVLTLCTDSISTSWGNCLEIHMLGRRNRGHKRIKMSPNNKICQNVAKVLFPKLQSVENNHKYASCCILLLFNWASVDVREETVTKWAVYVTVPELSGVFPLDPRV